MRLRFALALVLSLALNLSAAAQRKPIPNPRAAAPSSNEQVQPDFSSDPNAKLLVENDKTAAYRLELPPHGESTLHRHAHDYLLIALSPINARAVWGKNDSRAQNMSPGQLDIIKIPVVHKIVNQSDQPYRALMVDLKDGFHPDYIVCGLGKRGCPSDTGDLQDPSAQYTISELFDTDTVSVIKMTIGPGATLPQRDEKYPALRVALTDLSLSDNVGDKTESIHLPAGDVQWLPPQGTHTITNPTQQEAEFYWIEFK